MAHSRLSIPSVTSAKTGAGHPGSAGCPAVGPAIMTNENLTENDIDRLHYASARSGKRRALHVDKDCPDLKQASQTNSAPIMNLPRGSLCQRCGADYTLDELRDAIVADGGEDLPTDCPSCGHGSTTAGTGFWDRTPQGRPTCPNCGMIPEGFTLRTMEVPADD